jgi:hypothetical protein
VGSLFMHALAELSHAHQCPMMMERVVARLLGNLVSWKGRCHHACIIGLCGTGIDQVILAV